ncbi:putative sulfate exporter family transporter [Leifsonia sp. ZF2019]|uniref:YeiH family protein n=1 Tax=Leifsonia sp. ZF2019 TaxID=2781978 RepID=UPI001CC10DC0|nr:putative sulfate exporter family transporter [Leifsonia sp. ZF2019]UAJ80124.1 putative sulfate exporter family transporter [Leifsonia sp. ZF2019]
MNVAPVRTLPSRLAARAVDVAPGVGIAVAIALVATAIARVVPALGSALPALLLGVLVAVVRKPTGRFAPGVAYSGKFLLQLAVVLLGVQLSLASILVVGVESLPVMLSSLVVCLLAAWLIGRALRIPARERTLIGVGTGICGASAIAAISPIIGATSAEIAYAVSTIFLFNAIAVVVFPYLGHALGMDPHTFGLFAGTAVNDTSSVVAAASLFATSALGFAVVVKLVRTLMIIPISIGLAIAENRRRTAGEPMTLRRAVGLVPWFLVGFLLVAVANTVIPIPAPVHDGLVTASVFLVSVALAGIGLSTDVAAIRRAGWRPLLLGATLSTLVAGTSLLVIWLTTGL